MACAFVVVSVSTAWGQDIEPVAEGTVTPFSNDADNVNWIIRGDNANGSPLNATIGVKYNTYENTKQYALFDVQKGFIDNSIVTTYSSDKPECWYYNGSDYKYNVGNIVTHFGYDGNFKPSSISGDKVMTGVPVNYGFTYYTTQKLDCGACNCNFKLEDGVQRAAYRKSASSPIYNLNIYRLKYTNLTSSNGVLTNEETTNITIGGLTPNVEYTLYNNDVEVGKKTGVASSSVFTSLKTDGTDFEATFKNVALSEGNNVFVLKLGNDQIRTLTVKKTNDPNAGPVNGLPTWEVEVCQDPDKTAGEIGENALTFSAKAVTHGKGHWEVYPQGANGGTLVTPNSENTKIDYLPIGQTTYAWYVVTQEHNPVTNQEEVCELAAIIRVKNNFVKAELSQPYYGTCGEAITVKAIDPSKYGSSVEGEWSFVKNDYDQSKVPEIVNSDSYETVVRDLPLGSTTLKWYVKNGTDGMCHDEKTVRIDNNAVKSEIINPKLTTICDPDDLTLEARGQRPGVSGWWRIKGVSDNSFDTTKINIVSRTQTTTEVKGLTAAPATYIFEWYTTLSSTYEDENGNSHVVRTCDDAQQISITNNYFTVDADPDEDNHLFLCDNKYTLKPTLPSGYTGSWTIDVQGSGLTFNGAEPEAQATVYGITDVEKSLTWTVWDNVFNTESGKTGVCHNSSTLYLTDEKKYIKPAETGKKIPFNCGANIPIYASDFSNVDGIYQQWTTTSSGTFQSNPSVADNVIMGIGSQETAQIKWYVKTVNGCEDEYITYVKNDSYTLPAGQTITTNCKDEYLFTPDYITEVSQGKYDASKYTLVPDINIFTIPTGADEPEFYCWITMESGSTDFEFEKDDQGKYTGKVKFTNLANNGENRYVWHIRSRITDCPAE